MTNACTVARRLTAALALAAMAWTLPIAAEETSRDLYVAALSREHAVRATFSGTPAPEAALRNVRAIVTSYQALVRRFPSSGYSHDALWQAGRLELDAFARFGEVHDRDVGIKLLRRLALDYPTSKLAKRVPEAIAAVDKVQAPAKLATIKSIRRTVLPDAVRIVIELDNEVAFQDDRAGEPDRLLIDLASAQPSVALADQTVRFASDSDIVRQVRLSKPAPRASRITLDAAGIATYSIYALYDPFRLVVDCVRGSRPVPLLSLTARTLPLLTARKLPNALSHTTAAQLALASAELTDVSNAGASPTSAREAPADRNANGGYSIARQLGLGVSRIVIDPGHGGHDPGAMGNGVSEAELVLDIALRVEKLLQKQPGIEVKLTRRTDEFVPLSERTAIANRENADLFLSIHANASEDPAGRGIETYFLNFANNLSAASVAARENAASGQSMGALPDFVKAIALNNKLDESRDFATYVQRSMIDRLRLTNKTTKDLGVKQAPFVVLIGAAMPSVLTEISFVTNPQEARLLKSSAFRQRISDALFAAIKKYQSSLRSVATVAHENQ